MKGVGGQARSLLTQTTGYVYVKYFYQKTFLKIRPKPYLTQFDNNNEILRNKVLQNF